MRSESISLRKNSLKPLHVQARELAARFSHISFEHVKRAKNARADELANMAMDAKAPAGTYLVAYESGPAQQSSLAEAIARRRGATSAAHSCWSKSIHSEDGLSMRSWFMQ